MGDSLNLGDRSSEGIPDADEMVRRHLDAVYNLALRLTGNTADAWDLAQESMLRAVRALPGFRGESKVDTWLFRITVNAWKNRVQSRSGRWWSRLVSLDTSEDPEAPAGHSPAGADPPPDHDLERAEARAAIESALRRLHPEERAVLVLRELEEKSYEDIALILNIPAGTVKSRLHRARKELADALEGHDAS